MTDRNCLYVNGEQTCPNCFTVSRSNCCSNCDYDFSNIIGIFVYNELIEINKSYIKVYPIEGNNINKRREKTKTYDMDKITIVNLSKYHLNTVLETKYKGRFLKKHFVFSNDDFDVIYEIVLNELKDNLSEKLKKGKFRYLFRDLKKINGRTKF